MQEVTPTRLLNLALLHTLPLPPPHSSLLYTIVYATILQLTIPMRTRGESDGPDDAQQSYTDCDDSTHNTDYTCCRSSTVAIRKCERETINERTGRVRGFCRHSLRSS